MRIQNHEQQEHCHNKVVTLKVVTLKDLGKSNTWPKNKRTKGYKLLVPVTRKANELVLTGRAAWTRWTWKRKRVRVHKMSKTDKECNNHYKHLGKPRPRLKGDVGDYHCAALGDQSWKTRFYICSSASENKTHVWSCTRTISAKKKMIVRRRSSNRIPLKSLN